MRIIPPTELFKLILVRPDAHSANVQLKVVRRQIELNGERE